LNIQPSLISCRRLRQLGSNLLLKKKALLLRHRLRQNALAEARKLLAATAREKKESYRCLARGNCGEPSQMGPTTTSSSGFDFICLGQLSLAVYLFSIPFY